jgi:hypothetical protein
MTGLTAGIVEGAGVGSYHVDRRSRWPDAGWRQRDDPSDRRKVTLWSLSAHLRDTRAPDYVARLAAARDDASAELNQKYLEYVRANRSRAGLPALGLSNELFRSHTLKLSRISISTGHDLQRRPIPSTGSATGAIRITRGYL